MLDRIAVLLLLVTSAAEARIACQANKPHGAHDWWSWREVEHRRCWYAGAPGLGKAALYWPAAERSGPPLPPRSQSLPVPAVPLAISPVPAVPLSARAIPFSERWWRPR
jgi:hypothetical protein